MRLKCTHTCKNMVLLFPELVSEATSNLESIHRSKMRNIDSKMQITILCILKLCR